MADIDDVEKQYEKADLMTPDGIATYAHALINVQRREQLSIMAELKEKQEYFDCDEDNKELFKQIVSGYDFATEECLPELDDCYLQLVVKKSEYGLGYDMSCTFCREKEGKSYWFTIAPADYFLLTQLMGNYKPNVIQTFAPYFFFQPDIVTIVDGVVKSQLQVRASRKKIKIIR
jgi:hypothetical protein